MVLSLRKSINQQQNRLRKQTNVEQLRVGLNGYAIKVVRFYLYTSQALIC